MATSSATADMCHTRPCEADQFTLRSRWSMHIPETDICTWLFTSPTHPLPTTPQYIDAEKPETHNLSLTTYRHLVQRIARGLTEVAGVKPGDRVLVFSGNNVYFPSVYLGVVAAGCIFTGANPGYTARELAYQIRDSGATVVIANSAAMDATLTACRDADVPLSSVYEFDDGLILGASNGGGPDRWTSGPSAKQPSVRHWSELVSSRQDWQWERLDSVKKSNRTCVINYSSGTTGMPKGVELTHRNFISNTSQVVMVTNLAPSLRALEHRWIGALPMYHAYGQTYYTMLAPALNIPLYILPRFDFLQFLSYLQHYRITTLAAVPPILNALAKHPAVQKFDLSALRSLGSGAAPLSREIETAVEGKLHKMQGTPDLRIRQGWGMTEATCSVLGFHPHDISSHDHGSVGELFPNCSGRILATDGSGRLLAANEPGEILINAPNVCKGYWRNPAATREAFTDDGEWLRTGDVGYYDTTGKWYVVDRKKELIKVRGNQVAPAELEGVLMECGGIEDVAIVGVAADGDERPRAYIVRRPGWKGADGKREEAGWITEDEVKKWVEERCVRYKWITGGVLWVDEIPKNPSGKILRKVLREMVANERAVKAKL